MTAGQACAVQSSDRRLGKGCREIPRQEGDVPMSFGVFNTCADTKGTHAHTTLMQRAFSPCLQT